MFGQRKSTQRGARTHPSQWAFRVHRFSGLALVLYLPVHFWTLAEQIDTTEPLSDTPGVSAGLALIAGLLAVHFVGGLRVLSIRILGIRRGQLAWLMVALGAGMVVALGFLLALSHR